MNSVWIMETIVRIWGTLFIIAVKSRITFDVYILNQNDIVTHDLLFFNSTDCLSSVATSSYHAFITTTEHSPGVFNYTIQNATITTTPSFSFCKELQPVTDYSFP